MAFYKFTQIGLPLALKASNLTGSFCFFQPVDGILNLKYKAKLNGSDYKSEPADSQIYTVQSI
jgi:hypothetical protein